MSRRVSQPTPQEGDPDFLSDDWIEVLRHFPSETAKPSGEVDDAIRAMARRCMAGMDQPQAPRRPRFYVWPATAAAACAIFALAWFLKPTPSPSVAQVSERPDYAHILREVNQVFPNQLRAISTDGSSLSIELIDEPSHEERQTVVIQLNDHQKITGVITYVGQTVLIANREFTIRRDADGNILIDGGEHQGRLGEPIRIAPNVVITTETIS